MVCNLYQNNDTNSNPKKKRNIINLFSPAGNWTQITRSWDRWHTNVPLCLNNIRMSGLKLYSKNLNYLRLKILHCKCWASATVCGSPLVLPWKAFERINCKTTTLQKHQGCIPISSKSQFRSLNWKYYRVSISSCLMNFRKCLCCYWKILFVHN